MLRVFTLDGTEKLLYYDIVKKYVIEANLKIETSIDRAIARIPRDAFDLIIVSKATGKSDLMEVAEAIKASRLNKKAEVIILADNPTLAARLGGILRGRRVYNLKSNQLERLDDLLERMSA